MDFKNNSDIYDQHFLVDKEVIDVFVKEAHLKKDDIVIEIGPGKGNISNKIADKVNKIYCIELDKRLQQYLEKISKEHKNMEIIYANVLDVNFPKCTKIVTSLPYSIIEPFINKIINYDIEEIIMITGQKFANNVINNKITMLSVLTNCYFKCEKIMDISPEAFEPSPRVMSSMIRLIALPKHEIKTFTTLLFRYMFYYRDKKNKNALLESLICSYNEFYNLKLTKNQGKEIIKKLEIDTILLDKKFENCSNSELEQLYQKIKLVENDKNRFGID